ncbi:LANO_0C01750g1_1 [Lachancea nothofagi CBS 11611]|uniref:LANO_0C01750g1_1 n=1 Tax=Lachancea nothofagi CBS 11611 TaxID=1266666 RepID=A0A1G4J488_9SACH|nr:LANO_0C01750g1_1 [Lachancea nothofagi CBS 11611]
MKVFVTGATGFIGTSLVRELLNRNHTVVALARSAESEKKIIALGQNIQILRGSLKDLDVLRKGASEADCVAHLGFIRNYKNFAESCYIDREATLAMLDSLKGSHKGFIYSNGTLVLERGKLGKETDIKKPSGVAAIRAETEDPALIYREKGVRVSIVRLASIVHGKGDNAFVPALIDIAKKSGISGYIEVGQNALPAVARDDAARLYQLVVEKGRAGGIYHGVAEQAVKTYDIAKAIGELLDVPLVSIDSAKAQGHFDILADFFSANIPVSSGITRSELNWEPKEPELVDDICSDYRP